MWRDTFAYRSRDLRMSCECRVLGLVWLGLVDVRLGHIAFLRLPIGAAWGLWVWGSRLVRVCRFVISDFRLPQTSRKITAETAAPPKGSAKTTRFSETPLRKENP